MCPPIEATGGHSTPSSLERRMGTSATHRPWVFSVVKIAGLRYLTGNALSHAVSVPASSRRMAQRSRGVRVVCALHRRGSTGKVSSPFGSRYLIPQEGAKSDAGPAEYRSLERSGVKDEEEQYRGNRGLRDRGDQPGVHGRRATAIQGISQWAQRSARSDLHNRNGHVPRDNQP